MKYLLLLFLSLNCFAIDLVAERKLATNDSIATTFSSIYLDLNQYRGIAIQAIVSSSAAISGTLKLQASNDFTTIGAISNWNDLSGFSTAITGNSSVMWNVVDPYYRWIRLFYSPVSGSGVLNSTFNVKDFVNEK